MYVCMYVCMYVAERAPLAKFHRLRYVIYIKKKAEKKIRVYGYFIVFFIIFFYSFYKYRIQGRLHGKI